MLLGQHCSRLSTILLSAATPDWELIQANNIVYNQELFATHNFLPCNGRNNASIRTVSSWNKTKNTQKTTAILPEWWTTWCWRCSAGGRLGRCGVCGNKRGFTGGMIPRNPPVALCWFNIIAAAAAWAGENPGGRFTAAVAAATAAARAIWNCWLRNANAKAVGWTFIARAAFILKGVGSIPGRGIIFGVIGRYGIWPWGKRRMLFWRWSNCLLTPRARVRPLSSMPVVLSNGRIPKSLVGLELAPVINGDWGRGRLWGVSRGCGTWFSDDLLGVSWTIGVRGRGRLCGVIIGELGNGRRWGVNNSGRGKVSPVLWGDVNSLGDMRVGEDWFESRGFAGIEIDGSCCCDVFEVVCRVLWSEENESGSFFISFSSDDFFQDETMSF